MNIFISLPPPPPKQQLLTHWFDLGLTCSACPRVRNRKDFMCRRIENKWSRKREKQFVYLITFSCFRLKNVGGGLRAKNNFSIPFQPRLNFNLVSYVCFFVFFLHFFNSLIFFFSLFDLINIYYLASIFNSSFNKQSNKWYYLAFSHIFESLSAHMYFFLVIWSVFVIF